MGAVNYLVHEAFAHAGVQVEYMSCRKQPYPKQHGDFTPHINALDLVANMGHDGTQCISSSTTNWKEFLHNE